MNSNDFLKDASEAMAQGDLIAAYGTLDPYKTIVAFMLLKIARRVNPSSDGDELNRIVHGTLFKLGMEANPTPKYLQGNESNVG